PMAGRHEAARRERAGRLPRAIVGVCCERRGVEPSVRAAFPGGGSDPRPKEPSGSTGAAPLPRHRAPAGRLAGGGRTGGGLRGPEPARLLVLLAVRRRPAGAGPALLRDELALRPLLSDGGARGGAVWTTQHDGLQPSALQRAPGP